MVFLELGTVYLLEPFMIKHLTPKPLHVLVFFHRPHCTDNHTWVVPIEFKWCERFKLNVIYVFFTSWPLLCVSIQWFVALAQGNLLSAIFSGWRFRDKTFITMFWAYPFKKTIKLEIMYVLLTNYLQIYFLWNVILRTGLVSQTCGVSWSVHVCQQGTNKYFANSVVAIESVSTIFDVRSFKVIWPQMQSLSEITLTLLKTY